MHKNHFTCFPQSVYTKKDGSVESQICCLTNRIVKLTRHFQTHRKDYSSQRGLWKILGRRKRLLIYLLQTDAIGYRDLTTQLKIRKLKKK
uniref:30S ribosomal protein S15 n=1 Tax=Aneura pinguis TaxID=39026 RepID=A0A1Z1G5X0_ANEPI|nr:ribosomal protein S15 [Aneura pinguis]WGO59240.1 ribosomal protein S15 [Aneura pinguis]